MNIRKLLLTLILMSFTFQFVGDLSAQENQKNFGFLPAFSAETDQGNQLTSKDLKDKFLVINFFFTSCEGPCPVLMENVRKLAEDIKNPNIRFLSFSVDQDVDTIPVLAEYKIKRNLIDPRIMLLRTSKAELERLLNKDFKLGSGDSPVDHSTRFVIVDNKGKIRALFSGSYKDLLSSIRNLLGN